MKKLIVAHDKNRVIGDRGSLPWQGDLPADMQHFRATTMGSALIMGRLTFESIGRPLPGRDNIVLTTRGGDIGGCKVAATLEEAYELVGPGIDSFVIGGESVYRQALGVVEQLHVTEIDAEFEGDRFFPQLSPDEWRAVNRDEHPADAENRFAYRFVVYQALR